VERPAVGTSGARRGEDADHDGEGVHLDDQRVAMPITGGTIGGQTGAAGGLWTHTPVDWRGNEPPGSAKPGGWPTDAAVAIPPNGSTAQASGQAVLITAISVSGITATGATVNFTLSQSASNQIDYGTTMQYGSSNTPGAGTGAQSKPLSGLTTGTLYHYRIAAYANGYTTYSADGTFTTS
jgi:hypothetical protein